jgi:hypothetical protein
MRRNRAAAICLPILLGAIAPAHANGALAEFPAGGVVFKSSKDISIAREDLEIGWNRIRVRYVFRSAAAQPVETTIGFPLAKVPQDDSPDGIGDRDYMAFKVAVDGRPLTPKLHEYAWFNGVDITGKLREMGVPVFAADKFEELPNLPEATVAALKAEGLAQEEGDWLVPQWLYQAVYEWQQNFAPGTTEVEVSYQPRMGATNAYGYYYPGGEGAEDYCLDETVKRKLSGDAQPEPFTVGYILTTAKNWNGPIGEFHLKVEGKDSFASFCVPEGLTPGSDGKSWIGRDFVPQADLKVVFFYHGNGE